LRKAMNGIDLQQTGRVDYGPMQPELAYERLLKIRKLLLLATGDVKKERIATDIGCKPSTITSLIRDRRMGPDLLDRLEAWLREHDYWLEDAPIARPTVDPALVKTARDLQALSDFLLDPRPKPEDKARELARTAKAIVEVFGFEIN
jgi:hypothetical protein